VLGSLIPDDGGSTHLWNVGRQSIYTAVYPRRQLWTSTSWLVSTHVILTFVLGNWRKMQKAQVKVPGCQTGIWRNHLRAVYVHYLILDFMQYLAIKVWNTEKLSTLIIFPCQSRTYRYSRWLQQFPTWDTYLMETHCVYASLQDFQLLCQSETELHFL
jgi:hypothetical protein